MARSFLSSIEPLEARIAPAAIPLLNPLPDLVAGLGKTGASIDLGNAFDVDGSYHSFIEFTTNFDTDTTTAGLQAGKIVIELFDDTTPLTVQNFLAYVNETNAQGDYVNTFFHRLAFNDNGTPTPADDTPFVLQGGGFNSETFTHLTTKPTVHNEFATAYPGFGASATDDLRANVRGTVAMAKVGGESGGGPNTASSEWFVNLGDNSANLDAQNGGFTVFGKVTTASLTVIDAIAAQGRADIRAATQNGALSDVPYNPGYNPNPDSNPNTPSPKPTVDQLIRITGVSVTAPLQGDAPAGTTFEVVSITDAATNQPTGLVTGALAADTLNLTYNTAASGVAKVIVRATNGADTTTDEFLVTVKSNLIAESALDTFGSLVVPGDAASAKVKISNNTAAVAQGLVDVKFYLSVFDAADPFGTIFNPGMDVEVGSLTGLSLNLASGQSATFTAKVGLKELIEVQSTQYRLIAQVTPQGGAISELYTDDNTMLGGGVHGAFNAFGDIPNGIDAKGNPVVVKKSLTYTDAAGELVTMSAKGGGYGQLFVDANGLVDLFGRGVDGGTTITAKTLKNVHTSLRNVLIEQPTDNLASRVAVGTLALGSVDVTGNVLAFGGVKNLTLGNLTGAGSESGGILIGTFSEAPGQKAKITLGTVTDYELGSDMPISSLSVLNWRDVNAATEVVQTTFLDTLSSKNNFEADLRLTGAGLLKTMTIAGTLKNSNVTIAGNVGNVTLGGMDGSKFVVGTTGGIVPDDRGDFNAVRSIASFIVKGGAGLEFSDSFVAASTIKSIKLLAPIASTAPTENFGVVADRIARFQRGNMVGLNLDARDFNGDGLPDPTLYDPITAVPNYKLLLV